MSKRIANKQSQSGFKQGWAAVLLAFTVQTTLANPLDPSVVNGQASFATAGNTLTVTNTPGAIINWQGFSIGANEVTRFAQQSASSSVLNRVISNNPSSILGALQSNGRVFLVNPNGIVFGAGATVDVAGLVATSLNLSNADFLAGRYNFTDVPGAQNISNAGNLTAHGDGLGGGQIYLIAPNVENSGVISAPNGEILLAAGHSVELVNSIEPNLRVNITAPAGDATNVGQLVAEAGSLGLFGTVVRNSGTVNADSATLQGGKIVFKASQRVEAGGTISAQGVGGGTINVLADMQTGIVNVSGTLDASAPNSGNGGFIETSAAHVQVADTAHITTAAPNGKTGTWLIDPNDYTIAASGGDITGAQLSTNLGGTSVTIVSSGGATAGSGDVNVNDAVSWSANTLTLTAARDININAVMTASGTSALALNPATANGADAAVAGGTVKAGFNTDGTFRGRVDFGARSGTGFLSINGNGYTVINSLGAAGSVTGTDLQGMQGNLAGRYALGSNIDASTTAGWNGGLGFAPVGNLATSFTGAFDGLGHTITGLTINRPTADAVGLFGFANAATIRNVGLVGGGVTGGGYVGGLVGYNSSTITNSYSTASVTAVNWVGGLVGNNFWGSINNSYSTGTVSGNSMVGGLVGNNENSAIANSYSIGGVTGTSWYVGGLAGYNWGTIANSYSTGSVAGTERAGGLVGDHSAGPITNSYSTGAVTGTANVGGLVGFSGGGTNTNSYWDTQTSGRGASAGGTGKTTAEMKQLATFIGWDFTNTWRIEEGVSYPTLRAFWTPPPPSNIFWDGGAGDWLWLSALNWSGDTLPTSANHVLIDTGAVGGSPLITVTVSSGAQGTNNLISFEHLLISSAASLAIAGTATINANLTSDGITSFNGTGAHSITGAVSGAGTINLIAGTLTAGTAFNIGSLGMSGGSLALGSLNSSVGNFSQSAGTLSGIGNFIVSNNYSQTGGSFPITFNNLSITQASGNLSVGALQAVNSIALTATTGSIQLGLLDAGAGSVQVVAGENITDGNGASNNIKAGYASLVASNTGSGPGSIDVDTQVPDLYVDNWKVGQPNNPVTVRNSGSALSVSVYSGIYTGQLTISNNNTIDVNHIGGALNTTLTATGASSDISVAAGVGSLLSAGNIILNAGRDILITHDYVDAGGTVTATAGRDIRLLSVVLQQGSAPTYIQAANGIDLTMQSGGLYIDGDIQNPAYVAATSGNINVVTSAGFANGSISGFGGTSALSAPSGRWLVYASSPATVTKNGLIPTLYQYNTVYGGTVAPTGSGFIYASPLYVDANFSGTLSSTYGTSPTATPGYVLRGLDSDDAITAITGSAIYSNWPITPSTAAASYPLQYASGLLPGSLPYSLTPGTSQTYTVNPATLTIVTASLTGLASKTYDGTTTATLAPGNFLLSGFVSTDSATVTKTTGTYASPNVGSGILVSTTLTPADYSPAGSTNLSNYTLPTSASGPIGSITTAPLTVTANPASKIYNGQPFSGGNGVSYSGLVNGETAAVLGGLLAYSGNSQGAINNGSYVITPGGYTSSNYDISYANGTLSIGAASLFITASLTGTASKTYDGTATVTLAPGNFLLGGFVGTDSVTVTKTTGTYVSPNVGSGIMVSTTLVPTDFSPVASTNLSNYILPTSASGNVGSITVRPLSTWSGLGGNNLWSNPANWDALPSGNNVLAVSIPAGGSVTYDGAVINTALQTLTSAGNMLLNGNNLDIGNYIQTGGSLTGNGNLNVANSFSQAGGTITLTGASTANITQSGGNLNIANLSAPAANLTASTGAITQTGPIIVAALATQSATGTTLTDIGNQITGFSASNSASGNIALTNTGVLTIAGINNNGGDIVVDNTGAVVTTGAVSASGAVSITAHSPITIGNTVSAGGKITLTAGAPGSPVASDIITINGAISGGSIILAAHSVTGTMPIPAGAVLEIYKEPATPSIINNMVSNIVLIPPAPEAPVQTPAADAAATEEEKKKDAQIAAQDAAATVAEPAPAVASLPVCK